MLGFWLSLPALLGPAAHANAPAGAVVALRAGAIYTAVGNEVIQDGTILVQSGRIVAVGKSVAIPPNAEIVDYGPDAVIAPGFVLADSNIATGNPPARTAEPTLSALANFDTYARYDYALAAGITSAYITPARMRLVAGQGAVVKLAGGAEQERVLKYPAALHGALSAEARTAQGYWEPPVPPTSDTGLGVFEPQLPRTLIGAGVAMRELLVAARGARVAEDFGPYASLELAGLLQKRMPWLISAVEEPEIRVALDLARDFGLNLVVNDATYAEGLAEELAKAGASVVYKPPFNPDGPLVNRGRSPDARWPAADVASRLAAAGVRLAIAPSPNASPRELRFAACIASRGGLDAAVALRAITATPAEIYGVADRVGTIQAGRDADFAVLNGAPLALDSQVIATWSDGRLAWAPDASALTDDGAALGGTVVVEAAELHLGDGHVLRPGQVLVRDGKIAEVGERVSRPRGALFVRARAAMPGIIDSLGFLGLEGSARSPTPDFRLSRILGPGDAGDRRVARAGVTSIVLSPRSAGSGGAPLTAYKPAASDFDSLILRDPLGVRVKWNDRNRTRSGADVIDLLEKAQKYAAKWSEYEKALASWKPEAAKPEAKKAEESKSEGDKKEEAKDGDAKEGEKAEGEKKDEDKKDDKKKKGEEAEPADPVTGIWEGELPQPPPLEGKAAIRLQLKNEAGKVHGSLRCDALSTELVRLEGSWADKQLMLNGLGTRGAIVLGGDIAKGKLQGAVLLGSWQADFDAAQTSKEYPIAARPERRKAKEAEGEAAKDKGKPQPPRVDERLESLRLAMLGKAPVIVDVDRADEIAKCVDTFERFGIKPVLYGAEDAHELLAQLRGRVAGVIIGNSLFRPDPPDSMQRTSRCAELQNAGIPVAFNSGTDEGAADLLLRAYHHVSQGMSTAGALRALTSDAATMLCLQDRVGRIAPGLDGDLLLLDRSPLEGPVQVLRTILNGREVLP